MNRSPQPDQRAQPDHPDASQHGDLDPPGPHPWLPSPPSPRCQAGEVHVWRARLELDLGAKGEALEDGHPGSSEERGLGSDGGEHDDSEHDRSRHDGLDGLDDLLALLSPEELTRAERTTHAASRRRFVAARGRLRQILARYLDAAPQALVLTEGRLGKPELGPSHRVESLSFNLSHAGGQALVAVAHRRAVGIDLERIRHEVDCEAIAERYFAPEEQAWLAAIPPAGRTAAFFRIWTAKEAFVKALGEGLQRPLPTFAVRPDADGQAWSLTWPDAPDDGRCWMLRTLAADPGYAAALAVEGKVERLHFWNWTE